MKFWRCRILGHRWFRYSDVLDRCSRCLYCRVAPEHDPWASNTEREP